MPVARILVADDDPEMLDLLRDHLEGDGFSVVTATGGQEGLEAVQREDCDVVLTDLVMGDAGGLEVLAAAQRRRPSPHVILMTAFGSLESAIEAMRHGAYDYLTKPFKLAQATVAINRALDDRRLRQENERLRAHVERADGIGRILGRSPAIAGLLEQVRAIADSDAPVLLLGESGTGKELVAHALHWSSRRKGGALVPVNCGAIPDTLLEAELFGHEKGAFTGADRKRRGLFMAANGGTLFLDEIAELSLALQVKLLRVVQDGAVRPVGGTATVQLDVRLVTATNRDIAALVRGGAFREDLYYRIAVVPIRVPTLRERPDDIPVLAASFLERAARRVGKRLSGFSEDACAWMARHRWPGNVRELENVVERAVVLAKGEEVTLADLGTQFSLDAGLPSARLSLHEVEGQYIRSVLEETRGDKRAAARILGISLRTLQRRAGGA